MHETLSDKARDGPSVFAADTVWVLWMSHCAWGVWRRVITSSEEAGEGPLLRPGCLFWSLFPIIMTLLLPRGNIWFFNVNLSHTLSKLVLICAGRLVFVESIFYSHHFCLNHLLIKFNHNMHYLLRFLFLLYYIKLSQQNLQYMGGCTVFQQDCTGVTSERTRAILMLWALLWSQNPSKAALRVFCLMFVHSWIHNVFMGCACVNCPNTAHVCCVCSMCTREPKCKLNDLWDLRPRHQ